MLTFHSISIFSYFLIFIGLNESIRTLLLFVLSISMLIEEDNISILFDLGLLLGGFSLFATIYQLIFEKLTLELGQVDLLLQFYQPYAHMYLH